MPFRKLGGKFHFFLQFCTRKRSKTYIFMYILDFLPDDPHQDGKDEQQHEKSPSVVTSMFSLSLNKLIQSHVKQILLLIIIIT